LHVPGRDLHGHMTDAAAAGQLDRGLALETDNSPRALTQQLADLFGTAAIGSRTTRDKTAGNIVGPQFFMRLHQKRSTALRLDIVPRNVYIADVRFA
jgi:hypothetical protein